MKETLSVLYEIKEKRGEREKHFALSDGSFVAAMYEQPMHYESEGKFRSIDSRLDLVERDGIAAYKTKANSFQARFPKELHAKDQVVSMEQDKVCASFRYMEMQDTVINAEQQMVESVPSATKAATKSKALLAGKETVEQEAMQKAIDSFAPEIEKHSRLVYKNVQPGVDLQYEAQTQGVKESIVLNENTAKYSFLFELSLVGLEAKPLGDGTIRLNEPETNKLRFVIPAPFMVDSKAECCDAVHYTLQEIAQKHNEKTYHLTINVDQAWLSSKNRAYPVIVDPVIRLPELAEADDVSIAIVRSDGTRETTINKVEAGCNNINTESRTYVKLALPKMAAHESISNAMLKLGQTCSSANGVYDVGTSWSQESITWENQPLAGDTYRKTVPIDYMLTPETDFDITKLVKRWIHDPQSNQGFMIATVNAPTKSYAYNGTLNGASTKTPYLMITYRNNVGLEKYWSTNTTNIGRGGTGNIGHFSGNMTYVHEDVATPGLRLPLGIQHVYNSTMKDQEADAFSKVGLGWRLNYQQTLKVPQRVFDATNYRDLPNDWSYSYFSFVYCDADGTEHHFKMLSDAYLYCNGAFSSHSTSVTGLHPAKDEDGLEMYIVRVTDPALKQKYAFKMQNLSGTSVLYFDNVGHLAMVSDSNQHENGSNSATRQKNQLLMAYERHGEANAFTEDLAKFPLLKEMLVALKEVSGSTATEIESFTSKYLAYRTLYDAVMLNNAYLAANFTCVHDLIAIDRLMVTANKTQTSRSTSITSAITALDALWVKLQDMTALLNSRLSGITDAVGRQASMIYDEQGVLVGITDPTYKQGEKISFAMDEEQHLTSITYPTGKKTQFVYTNALLTNAIDDTGYALHYQYDPTSERVVQVKEQSVDQEGNTVQGQTIRIAYGNDNTTSYTFSGKDDVIGTQDDIVNVYTFDASGRTQQVYSKGAENQKLHGASIYKYGDGNDTAGSKNKVIESAQSGHIVTNLLKNHSFERAAADWIYSNTANVGTPGGNRKSGAGALLCNGGLVLNRDKHGATQKVGQLVAGMYTLSGYVKTDALLGDGAFLEAIVKQGETAKGYKSESVTETTDNDFDSGWVRVSTTFEVPNNGAEVEVFAGIQSCTGKAYFDCLQLEAGEIVNEYNILENPSFDMDLADAVTPYGWTITGAPADHAKVTNETSMDGKSSYKIIVSEKETIHLSQTLSLGEVGGAMYTLSGWIKADLVPLRSSHRAAQIKVGDKIQDINISATGWSYFSVPFGASASLSTGILYPTAIKVSLYLDRMMGTVHLDHLQVVKQDAQYKTYTAQGVLASSSSYLGSTQNTYNSKSDQLATTQTFTGELTTYTYTDNHYLKNTKASNGFTTSYEYDVYGNVTGVLLGDTTQLYKGTRYTKDGNFAESSIDERGNVSRVAYDTTTGLLLSATNARDVVTHYEYDDERRMTSISGAGMTNQYVYGEDGRLTTITHNGMNIDFTYDAFGNPLSTAVGGQVLVTNEYCAGNGKLLSSTYANGAKMEQVYDELERVAGVQWNGQLSEEWAYDNVGDVVMLRDLDNHLEHRYNYDEGGRLVSEVIVDEAATLKDVNHRAIYYQSQKSYDKCGGISSMLYKIRQDKLKSFYTYDVSGRLLTSTLPNGAVVTNEYTSGSEPLRRLKSSVYDTKKSKSNNGAAPFHTFDTAYTYIEGKNKAGAAGLSTMVKSSEVKSGTKVLENQTYEYNELGNIESIHRTGAIKDSRVAQERIKFDKTSPLDTITYSYDDRNQLVREDNPFVGRTYTFAYDDGGNIIEKGEYAYSVQSVPARPAGELLTTHTYVYDEDNTDLLVEYNGQKIASDEQGNPTSYKGNHVTWAKGRRMASYGNMKYRYNPSGSRIGKSDGDTRTAYYLDGTRLIREETISDSNRPYVPGALESIDYHYDGHGTLASLSMKCYNRSVAEYYYLRNTLGDVVALCDAVGNIVAAYEYDAWGGVHGVYDGFGVNRIHEADFVGNLNPIRYRGYYYDTETKLYYLQSRYFDPGTGRFVNADSVIDSGHSLFGHNLYAYGNNNPIVYVDPSGCIPLLVITGLVGLLGGAIIGGCIAASKGESVLAGALVGGAVGGLIGVGAGALAGGLLGGSATASVLAVTTGVSSLAVEMQTGGLLGGGSFLLQNMKNATSSMTVLGRYPGYLDLAHRLNARVFDTPIKVWNKLGTAQQWALNQEFLQKSIDKGHQFIFSANAYSANEGSYLNSEVNFLLNKGYHIVDEGWRMIKR